jgi:hypothetical protein
MLGETDDPADDEYTNGVPVVRAYLAGDFAVCRDTENRTQSGQRCREADVAVIRVLSQMLAFIRARKKWWLLPVMVLILVVGALLVFAQGSALAPFIYSIF